MTHDPAIEIRQLAARDDFETAVKLQRDIWGFDEIDLLPLRLFVVASKIGGQVLGAFSGGKMVGFCLCIPGIKSGAKPYLHSHMMGVCPEYRNAGVGKALKVKQREYAIAVAVDLIEWTFDPLELKNAFFNIERLGAIVRRYVHNQYGTSSSHLHGGLPTDRLVAEWWVQSERVNAVITGELRQPLDIRERISVPNQIGEMRLMDKARARAIQESIGETFVECFRQDLAVVGFERTPDAGVYLLGTWESE